jgi:hypothetical protein
MNRRTALAAGLLVTALATACGSSSTSKAVPLDPLDVSAAKACAQAIVWGKSNASDTNAQKVLEDSFPTFLAGADEATASSRPLPKYAVLGAGIQNLITALVNRDDTEISKATNVIATECGKIPADARKAEGLTK